MAAYWEGRRGGEKDRRDRGEEGRRDRGEEGRRGEGTEGRRDRGEEGRRRGGTEGRRGGRNRGRMQRNSTLQMYIHSVTTRVVCFKCRSAIKTMFDFYPGLPQLTKILVEAIQLILAD